MNIKIEPKTEGISLELVDAYNAAMNGCKNFIRRKGDNLEAHKPELDRLFPGAEYHSWEEIYKNYNLFIAFRACREANRNTKKAIEQFFKGIETTPEELSGIESQFSMNIGKMPRDLLQCMNFAFHILRHGSAEEALAAYRTSIAK
jgi:hypothetical protein